MSDRVCRRFVGALASFVLLCAGSVVSAWDGEPWADYTPFITPITAPMKQTLVNVKVVGDANGRVLGRMGQIGDSISEASSFFRNVLVFGPVDNETGHDYAPIRSWLAYSGTQPADSNSFYLNRGKGIDYGSKGGWRLFQAVAAAHPPQGVEIGDGTIPGDYSWATIMFGTNDVDLGNWDPVGWKVNLKGFVQGYMDLGVVPVLSTIPPEGVHATDGLTEEANDAIKSVAFELGVPYVDYHALILHLHPDDWLGTLIGADGTHPSAGGIGRDFSQIGLTDTDGYAVRSKLALDVAEKIRDIVFENEPAESKVSLTLEVSRDEIAWNLLPYATWYDIVVGDLSDLRSSDGDFSLATDSCLIEDRRELFTDEVDDLDDPDAGEGTWFLIRAVVNGISGTYGDAGVPRDAGILASGHDCLQ